MKIHVLIPIPPPNPTGPDPPVVYHYTTGLKLRSIINTGHISPAAAHIEPNEMPVAWFTTSPNWEPTATKCPILGKAGLQHRPAAQCPGVPSPGPGGAAALCGRFGYASATAQGWSI